MDQHQITYREKLAQHLIKQLTKRRMEASYAPTAAQARDEILGMIPAGVTVSRCGSMSLVEMGLWEALAAKPGVTIIDPYRPGLSPEEGVSLRAPGLDRRLYDHQHQRHHHGWQAREPGRHRQPGGGHVLRTRKGHPGGGVEQGGPGSGNRHSPG